MINYYYYIIIAIHSFISHSFYGHKKIKYIYNKISYKSHLKTNNYTKKSTKSFNHHQSFFLFLIAISFSYVFLSKIEKRKTTTTKKMQDKQTKQN